MTAQAQAAQLLLHELDRLAVRAECPCRLDLAGGTLDLYPLCAFEAPTLTVNFAIDVLCRADLRARTDGRIILRSDDLGYEVRYDHLAELTGSTAETPLDLLVEAIRFWQPPIGLELVTTTDAPPGSGMGASSAMLVATLGALTAMFGGRYGRREPLDNMRLVQRAQAIEAKHLKVPTGSQDHIAALLGGVLGIRYDADGPYVEPLTLTPAMHAFLKEHLLVLYTGAHASASPNWAIFKAYVDGDEATRRRIEELKALATKMVEALVQGDQNRISDLLNEEWQVRRELAAGVTTPELDALVTQVREAGAAAARPVGAAAGGSVLVLAHPSRHVSILDAAQALGARRIDARPTAQGIRLTRLTVEESQPTFAVLDGGTITRAEGEATREDGAGAGAEPAADAGSEASADGAGAATPATEATGAAETAPAPGAEGAAPAEVEAAAAAPAPPAAEAPTYTDGDPTETLPAVGGAGASAPSGSGAA